MKFGVKAFLLEHTLCVDESMKLVDGFQYLQCVQAQYKKKEQMRKRYTERLRAPYLALFLMIDTVL